MIQFRTEFYDEIPSTSAKLLELAGQENFHGRVIVAHHQTQGKGRRGRTWETGKGNLAFSIGFAKPIHEQDTLPYMPLCAGIAVYDAISSYLTEDAANDLFLKWPNDISWRKKKLMGVLSQARPVDNIIYLSIGIGINIVSSPKFLPAISLAEMPRKSTDLPTKEMVLDKILIEMQKNYSSWNNFSYVKQEWEKRAKYLGKKIFYGVLEKEEEMEEAIAICLESSGALRVRHYNGEEKLLATEDLSLRL